MLKAINDDRSQDGSEESHDCLKFDAEREGLGKSWRHQSSPWINSRCKHNHGDTYRVKALR